MLPKLVIFLFVWMLVFFSTVIHAESNTNSINLLTAINKTFEHNPALRSFSYQLSAQNGRVLQAKLAASPEINFITEDVLGSGQHQGTDKLQATLSISWILEGARRQGLIDVAQAGTQALRTEANIKRLDAAAETARLYLICLTNQVRLVNANNTVTLAIDTVSAVNKRVTAGKTPEAELARAKAELARKKLNQEDIKHALSTTIRILAAQWGNTQPKFNKVEGELFIIPDSLSFDELKIRLNQSPEFTRLVSDKRLKQAKLKLAQAQSNPEWRINFGVRHFEISDDQALVAGISIPFGERSRNTGNISTAQANLSQTVANETSFTVRVETSLYVLYQQLQHSLHRVNTYRTDIIPQLENALEDTRRAYLLGRYSYFEWRSVQADLLDARSTLIEDSFNAHLNIIEIERLTGVSLSHAK